jgi:hypothetical protein
VVVNGDEAGITAGTEGGDPVIAVELLADAVALGLRAVPEQPVETWLRRRPAGCRFHGALPLVLFPPCAKRGEVSASSPTEGS